MNENYSIEGIFATPIYRAKLENIPLDFQQMVQKYINEGMIKNYGNYVSTDTQVLDQPDSKEIKKFIQFHLENYYKTVFGDTSTKTKKVITQSWLNMNRKNEYHHEHTHQNSIVSGVFYINTSQEDVIKFINFKYDQINVYDTDAEPTPFNSIETPFKVSTGDLLMFPSSTYHSVPIIKEDKNIRISMAFNTFIRGTVGENNKMTELKV